MELIEEQEPAEVELRHGPTLGSQRLLVGLLALLGLVLAVFLFRPSDPVRVAPTSTTALAAASEAGDQTESIEDEASGGRTTNTLVRPDQIDIPLSVELTGPPLPYTLIGQNDRGQIVAIDLASGDVQEIDRPSGQLFIPRVASNGRVAGFRVFLGESISIGPDGSLRTMPVTEMDLPVVYRAADGDGFVIHEAGTAALWAESDAGVVTPLVDLPSDVALRAVVDGGLVVATPDGVDRRFDPVTGEFGTALIGRVLAHGFDRYLSQTCDGGTCVVDIRLLSDNSVVGPIDLVLGRRDSVSISPSGLLLRAAVDGRIRLFDLESGEELEEIAGGLRAQSAWGPDDRLVYWSSDVQEATGPFPTLFVVEVGGDPVPLGFPPEVLDVHQPFSLVRTTD